MYLTSVFLGHTTASDLLSAFKGIFNDSLLSKLIQVSMNGPIVNMKFLDDLLDDPVFCDESHSLICIGICGLHVVHGAFQYGHKAAKWTVNDTLRAIYRMFKD